VRRKFNIHGSFQLGAGCSTVAPLARKKDRISGNEDQSRCGNPSP
jgi:hypothetical protein